MNKSEYEKSKIYKASHELSEKMINTGYFERYSTGLNAALVGQSKSSENIIKLVFDASDLDGHYVITGFTKIFRSDPTGIQDVKTGCFLRTMLFDFSFRKENINQVNISGSFVFGLDTIQALQYSGIALIFGDLVTPKQALLVSQFYIGNPFLQAYDKELEAEYKILIAALNAKDSQQSVAAAVQQELTKQNRNVELYAYIDQQFDKIWTLAIKHFKKEYGDYFGVPEAALFPTHLVGITMELVKEGEIVLDGARSWELLINAALQSNLNEILIEERFVKARELVLAQYGNLGSE
ncbi:MAG: hypothetical protein IPK77_00690 [Cellvibrio sp.]|nr:hypothetical protein [Cellvibrio sp.]